MRVLFDQILGMSLAGSWVIVFVLLARLMLRKAPARFRYLLWGLVLLRLLCPVTPESPASLMPEREPIHVNFIPAEAVTVQSAPAEYPPKTAEPPVTSDSGTPAAAQTWQAASAAQPSAPALPSAASLRRSALRILRVLWIPGAALLLAGNLLSLLRLRRRLVGAAPLRGNIWLADHIDTAFVLGVFRPRIYLPSALPPEEQAYILLHEQTHIRRLDPLWKLLGFAALCLHWFNPLVWLAMHCAGRDMELSCDEAVLARLGPEIRQAYAASLLRLSAGRQAGIAFGEGSTKTRILNVLRYKSPKLLATLAGATVVILLACGLLTDPVKTATLDDLAGTYEITDTLGSWQPTPTHAPPVFLSGVVLADGSLYVEAPEDFEAALWQGSFTEATLEGVGFDNFCFKHTTLSASDRSRLQAGNRCTWMTTGASRRFLLLSQQNGSLYLVAFDTDAHIGEDTTPCVEWVFRLRKTGDSLPLRSGTYFAAEMLYDAPEYSFTYTPDTMPVYSVSGSLDISVSGSIGMSDFSSPKEITLTEENFDALFRAPTGEEAETIRALRENAESVWLLRGDPEFLYLICQKGEGREPAVLLAYGYTDNQDKPASIRWLFRLSRTPSQANARNTGWMDGRYYGSVCYAAPHLSTMPRPMYYIITHPYTAQGKILPTLIERGEQTADHDLGTLEPVTLDAANFDALFPATTSDAFLPEQLRQNAIGAWQRIDGGEFCQLLLQSDGQIYLVKGAARDGAPLLASVVFCLRNQISGDGRERLYQTAYNDLIAFRAADYEALTVAEFNHHFAPDPDSETDRWEQYSLVSELLPEDDPNADFWNVTLKATCAELYAEKFNEDVYYALFLNANRRPFGGPAQTFTFPADDIPEWADEMLSAPHPYNNADGSVSVTSYGVSYTYDAASDTVTITLRDTMYHFVFDCSAYVSYTLEDTVTVETRDRLLRTLQTGLQEFVNAQSEEELRSQQISNRLKEAADSILAQTPHEGMQVTVEFNVRMDPEEQTE